MRILSALHFDLYCTSTRCRIYSSAILCEVAQRLVLNELCLKSDDRIDLEQLATRCLNFEEGCGAQLYEGMCHMVVHILRKC